MIHNIQLLQHKIIHSQTQTKTSREASTHEVNITWTIFAVLRCVEAAELHYGCNVYIYSRVCVHEETQCGKAAPLLSVQAGCCHGACRSAMWRWKWPSQNPPGCWTRCHRRHRQRMPPYPWPSAQRSNPGWCPHSIRLAWWNQKDEPITCNLWQLVGPPVMKLNSLKMFKVILQPVQQMKGVLSYNLNQWSGIWCGMLHGFIL